MQPPPASGDVPTEAVFNTLSNQRRRYVLYCLRERRSEVTVRDLSTQLAAWENDVPRDAVTRKERKRVYTALHQTHLPMMHDVGVLVYDDDRGTVALTDESRTFDAYLDVEPQHRRNWGRFYVGAGLVGVALIAATGVGVPPFTQVPDIGYAALLAVTLVLGGAVHAFADEGQ